MKPRIYVPGDLLPKLPPEFVRYNRSIEDLFTAADRHANTCLLEYLLTTQAPLTPKTVSMALYLRVRLACIQVDSVNKLLWSITRVTCKLLKEPKLQAILNAKLGIKTWSDVSDTCNQLLTRIPLTHRIRIRGLRSFANIREHLIDINVYKHLPSCTNLVHGCLQVSSLCDRSKNHQKANQRLLKQIYALILKSLI